MTVAVGRTPRPWVRARATADRDRRRVAVARRNRYPSTVPRVPVSHSGPSSLDAVPCRACRAALRGDGRASVSFLLLDRLRVPVVGCDDHLDRFASTCGLTTVADVDLLSHPPAGGIPCPSCRLAPHEPTRAVVPVDGGAVAVVACPEHRDAVVERYGAGAETRQRLTADAAGDR